MLAAGTRTPLTQTQDDPFRTELETFVNVVEERGSKDRILSSYEDAIKTYELVSMAGRYMELDCRDDGLDRRGRSGGQVRPPQCRTLRSGAVCQRLVGDVCWAASIRLSG